MTFPSLLTRPSVRITLLATAAFALISGAQIAARADTSDPSAAAGEQGVITLPMITVVADAPESGSRARGHGPDRAAADRPAVDKKLSLDQVRDIVAGNLAMNGNSNLKVGKITTKEDGIASAEIVTKTGALVDTREISTRTGLPMSAERRMERMHERFAQRRADHGGDHGPGKQDHVRGPDDKARDLALTTDQVKKLAEARLIMMGNPHLKVGAVKEKDADNITVDIVASDNSLVREEVIDRHSGHPQRPFGMRRA